MNIEPTRPTIKNSPEHFIGDVWVDPIAAPGCFMEHLAMLESADDPTATTDWKEHVSDAEFEGRQEK